MKTDIELQKDVVEELKWEPRVTDDEIGASMVRSCATCRTRIR